MGRCKQIRPILYRVAEGEADPGEAMRTARHLSDCTACRILLAREVRLAVMLEHHLRDSLPVGDDFVRTVMSSLPAEATTLRSRPTIRRPGPPLRCRTR